MVESLRALLLNNYTSARCIVGQHGLSIVIKTCMHQTVLFKDSLSD